MRLIDEISLKFLEAQTANLKIITETIAGVTGAKRMIYFFCNSIFMLFNQSLKWKYPQCALLHKVFK